MSLTVSEILALEELSPMRLRAGKQGLQLAVRWYLRGGKMKYRRMDHGRGAGLYHRHQPSPR